MGHYTDKKYYDGYYKSQLQDNPFSYPQKKVANKPKRRKTNVAKVIFKNEYVLSQEELYKLGKLNERLRKNLTRQQVRIETTISNAIEHLNKISESLLEITITYSNKLTQFTKSEIAKSPHKSKNIDIVESKKEIESPTGKRFVDL